MIGDGQVRDATSRWACARAGSSSSSSCAAGRRVVFTLAFPVMLMLIFGSIFDWRHRPPGSSFTQYFVTGMIASGLMATGFQNLAIQIPIERDRGVLKRLRGTPMPQWVYFAGKVLMVARASRVAETVLLLAMAVALFDLSLPVTGQQVVDLRLGVACSASPRARCAASRSPRVARTGRSAPAVVTPVALVLQFISGVFFVFTEPADLDAAGRRAVPAQVDVPGAARRCSCRTSFAGAGAGRLVGAGQGRAGAGRLVRRSAWCCACLTFRWTTRRDG